MLLAGRWPWLSGRWGPLTTVVLGPFFYRWVNGGSERLGEYIRWHSEPAVVPGQEYVILKLSSMPGIPRLASGKAVGMDSKTRVPEWLTPGLAPLVTWALVLPLGGRNMPKVPFHCAALTTQYLALSPSFVAGPACGPFLPCLIVFEGVPVPPLLCCLSKWAVTRQGSCRLMPRPELGMEVQAGQDRLWPSASALPHGFLGRLTSPL